MEDLDSRLCQPAAEMMVVRQGNDDVLVIEPGQHVEQHPFRAPDTQPRYNMKYFHTLLTFHASCLRAGPPGNRYGT